MFKLLTVLGMTFVYSDHVYGADPATYTPQKQCPVPCDKLSNAVLKMECGKVVNVEHGDNEGTSRKSILPDLKKYQVDVEAVYDASKLPTTLLCGGNSTKNCALNRQQQGEDNEVEVPSYIRFDAAAHYDVSDAVRVQVNVENLFDTNYFPDAHSNTNISTGEPLNARFTIHGKF